MSEDDQYVSSDSISTDPKVVILYFIIFYIGTLIFVIGFLSFLFYVFDGIALCSFFSLRACCCAEMNKFKVHDCSKDSAGLDEEGGATVALMRKVELLSNSGLDEEGGATTTTTAEAAATTSALHSPV